MTEALYVIPDIHGHKAKLDHALALIAQDGGVGARIIFLGDLVDRGPDSCGVIQTLMKGIAQGNDWTVLRGNHDQLFLDFLDSAKVTSRRTSLAWLSETMGGLDTLASYGLIATQSDPNWEDVRQRVPSTHRDFLASLPRYLETDDLILVHAGLRPGIALSDQRAEDLIWIREPFLSDSTDHGKLVVHGHTPVDYPEHHGNRVALDGGAAWGRRLYVARFEGRDCWLLSSDGDHRLLGRNE